MPRASTADCSLTLLEREPYTRGQRIGVLRFHLHDRAAGAGGGRPPTALGRVESATPPVGKEPATYEVEGRVRREPPREPEIRLGPEIVGVALRPAVLADGRPRLSSGTRGAR